MKKILLLILSLLMFACTNNTSIEEDKEAQISRLLKEADKKREETEKIVINEKGEKVVVEEVPIENNKKSHKGMSRGEIMEYEMTRVSEEMNAYKQTYNNIKKRKHS